MIPRWFTAFACAALIGAFFAGLFMGRHIGEQDILNADLPPEGSRWTPCFANMEAADLPLSLRDWRVRMENEGQDPTVSSMLLVPEGRDANAWIMPGCVAIEDRMGFVTFWDDRDGGEPRWIPHPNAPREDKL